MQQRILLVARILDSSGVPTHLFALAQGLKAMGWNVAIASGGQVGVHSHGAEWFESHGIPHYHIPFPGPSLRLENLMRVGTAFFALAALVRQFSPHLIHVHYRATSPYIQAIQLFYQIPFVSTLHLTDIPDSFLYRLTSFWGDRAIAVSSETRDCLIHRFRVSPDKIRIAYNGVDPIYFRPPTDQEFQHARQAFNLKPSDQVVSLLGRLEPVKGHDILIRALAYLQNRGCQVIALLAGEGSQGSVISQLADHLGVADLVRQIGYQDSRQVLWASDVSVLPSRKEGFGLVIAEAMFCRVVPVRTPAAGAYDQIRDGVNGFIVPFEDPEVLATRLQALFDNPDLKIRMAAAALETARAKFTQEEMLKKVVSIYQELL